MSDTASTVHRVSPFGSEGAGQVAIVATFVLILLWNYLTFFSQTFFSFLGAWQSIPLTLVFLAFLLLFPRVHTFFALYRRRSLRWGLLLVVSIAWAASSLWGYMRTGAFAAFSINPPVFLVIAAIALSLLVGSLRLRNDRLWAASIAFFLVALAAVYLAARPFDQSSRAAMPLWNIRRSGQMLVTGGWIYEYGSIESPVYLPFLFLPYLPFGMLNIDVRWANLVGLLALFFIVFRLARRSDSLALRICITILFTSVPFVYYAISYQLTFYWVYIALFLASYRIKPDLQRTGLLLAGLSRQLIWPVIGGWLIARVGSGSELKPLKRILSALRPAPVHALILVIFIGIILIDARAFFWSTFININSDALNALQGGDLQSSGSIALTPLLPFASQASLVLLTQGILMAAVYYGLHRSRLLYSNPMYSTLIIYSIFLCFNFVVYNYYWSDALVILVLLMADQARSS